MLTKKVTTHQVEETVRFAKEIGKQLHGCECIELISDIGGGKTTFVKGLALGAGNKNHVSSPTFTISKLYATPKFDIAHFDFYRLHEAGSIAYEIEESAQDDKTVIVVEWSEIIKHVLPKERLIIEISQTHDDERNFNLTYPDTLDYLLKSV